MEADFGSDKIGSKIRQATIERVPYMLVVGSREADAGQVAVRERSGTDLGAMSIEAFLALARDRIAKKM